MHPLALILVAFTLFLGNPAYGIAADTQELRIQRVDHYREAKQPFEPADRIAVVLSDGRRLKVPFYAATAISILTASDGSRFLLAKGSNCTMCDEAASLRLLPIGPGELKETQERYDYPGRLIDLESHKLVQKTRVFYGRCVNEPGDVVYWFVDYIGDDSKWHKQNGIARLSRTGEAFAKDTKTSLASVQRAVADRRCTELPGVERATEP